MADVTPATWLGAGYSSDSGAHTITMKTDDAASDQTLPELTDAEADPSTGNINNVAYAILEALFQAYLARVADDDTPASIAVFKNESTNTTTGAKTVTYTLQLTGTGTFTPTAT